ncbi:hypothetical protein [Microbacterium sp. NPDC076911]|uniref:hypothetical protein n=1 Tax=Microbacterium sp. NPDC076911 TaxID=3154958 RepID=UPI003448DCB3
MADHADSDSSNVDENAKSFDELIVAPMRTGNGPTFTTAFRGYDKDEVDTNVTELNERLRVQAEQVEVLKERQRRAGAMNAQSESEIERLQAELDAANEENRTVAERAKQETDDAIAETRDRVAQLEAELTAAQAQVTDAENRIQALSDELVSAPEETSNRHQFEEVLRVAEDQASVLLRNATVQGERLIAAAREEIENRQKETKAEAEAILSHAQHDAQQVRLRIDTEFTAHQTRIEREAARAAEQVSQAEQEAAVIRTEAEKGAAALRSMVARETAEARAEAEDAVRELRVRALEFEESLTRRQDDAQQEFLLLHNQAVAHADRITQDANEQVAASLEHSQRVALKADDFERLMRAQAQQIEADAQVRAHATLERAHTKAQSIIDTVTEHSQSVLRDAEDRTRQLRWQQHQLTSFMSEVKELIRPDGAFGGAGDSEPATDKATDSENAEATDSENADGVEHADGAEVTETDGSDEQPEVVEHEEHTEVEATEEHGGDEADGGDETSPAN